MKIRTTAVLVLLILVGFVAGAAFARGGSRRPHHYTFVGLLGLIDTFSATVTGPDANGQSKTIPFKIDETSSVESGLKLNTSVIVEYDYTLDSNTYKVVTLSPVRPGSKIPKSTFPDQDKPAGT